MLLSFYIYVPYHKVLGAYNLANEMLVESKFTLIDKLSLSLCKFCSLGKKNKRHEILWKIQINPDELVYISCIVLIGEGW